jgi:hypothetical protein
MREAITGPIAYAGAKITPRLVTRLLNDVGNDLDQLPILQHAMMRTWDAWQKKNTLGVPIDLPDYEKIGTMSMALNQHAEEAYSEINSDERKKSCELMFKALTDKAADVRGIRRPKSVADLCVLTGASEKEIISLVEVFRKTGRTFLMPPPNVLLDKSSIIDISHESLMRVWQRLISWTEEEVRQSNIYKRLGNDSANEAKGEASLWSDPELALGINWRDSFKNEAVLRKWAESFDVNFDQAISFLSRSEQHAIQLQKEKERALRNRRRIALAAIAILTIFSIVAISLWRTAVVQTHKAQLSDSLAQLSRDSALIAKDTADASKERALIAKDSADAAKYRALRSDSITKIEKGNAIAAEQRAVTAKDSADAAKDRAQDLLKKVAVAEYQRLIREGPIDQDLIRDSSFNYKLVAYDYHLGILKDRFKVKNAVEKDDELYQKLYYCVKYAPHSKNPPIEDVVQRISESVSVGKDRTINSDHDSLYLLLTDASGATDTICRLKQKLCVFAVDTPDRRIFVSTQNNDLVIFKYDDQFKASIENKIPLGGLITAIDYHNNPDVIFFGLKTGEIGYIKYESKKERNYQPVYRNQLSSKITAVDFFQRKGTGIYYLLATSIKGQAVVYQSGSSQNSVSDFLNTNVKLTEIALPENQTDIKNAHYDEASDRIILVTSKTTKLWNPFSGDLLAELESGLNPAILEQTKSQTQFYK